MLIWNKCVQKKEITSFRRLFAAYLNLFQQRMIAQIHAARLPIKPYWRYAACWHISCHITRVINQFATPFHFFLSRAFFDRRKPSTRLHLYWPVSKCAWAADCFYTGQSPGMQNPLMYGGGGGEGWWWGCRGGVVWAGHPKVAQGRQCSWWFYPHSFVANSSRGLFKI